MGGGGKNGLEGGAGVIDTVTQHIDMVSLQISWAVENGSPTPLNYNSTQLMHLILTGSNDVHTGHCWHSENYSATVCDTSRFKM